jgi:hypothetical protein
MRTLKFEYAISLSDYHMALYFGASIRYRRPLQIFLIVTALTAVYSAGGLLGVWPMSMLPAYVFLGYAVSILIFIARLQHGVLKYVKDPKSLIQKRISVTVDRTDMKVEIPDSGESSVYPLHRLFMVFEISRMFLIYLNAEQSVLLPFHAMSASDRLELRDRFRAAIGERLQTRFGFIAAPKMQPLDGSRRRFF